MMNPLRCALFAPFLLVLSTLFADVSDEQRILEIDGAWEKAFLINDITFFEENLHPGFVWVHNHVESVQEGREAILAKLGQNQKRDLGEPVEDLGSRTPRDVKVVVGENSAITYGFLIKAYSKRVLAKGKESSDSVTYHFMRTYSKMGDRWLLLGNHTMQVPEE